MTYHYVSRSPFSVLEDNTPSVTNESSINPNSQCPKLGLLQGRAMRPHEEVFHIVWKSIEVCYDTPVQRFLFYLSLDPALNVEISYNGVSIKYRKLGLLASSPLSSF
jgi:hypothetical protein